MTNFAQQVRHELNAILLLSPACIVAALWVCFIELNQVLVSRTLGAIVALYGLYKYYKVITTLPDVIKQKSAPRRIYFVPQWVGGTERDTYTRW